MKIEVKNFGCIKKGTIDLDKRFTVFVGYNNSGKTYMSQLLWELNFNTNRKLYDYGLSYFFKSYRINEHNKIFVLNRDTFSRFFEIHANYIKSTLSDLFNVEREYFTNENLSIEFVDDFVEKIAKVEFSLGYVNSRDHQEYYYFHKPSNSLHISIEKKQFESPLPVENVINEKSFETSLFFEPAWSYPEILIRGVYEMIFLLMFKDKKSHFILPATRDFFPSYYKYIYSVAKEEKELIDDRLKKGGSLESIKSLAKSPYTKATNALIENVYRLNFNPQIKNHHEYLLQELKEIIGGDIILKSAEGIAPIEFFLKLDNGKELDMYMSSSSANQLATLYLYFKFWAETENNYLIIDEPEENLHPENQIKLVNLLMKFADRGNKVLITTHSPLITDHVNNYANLSHLAETGMDVKSLIAENKLDMVAVETIKKEDYGVYFFNGDSIKEYTVDDYGVYFKDFADAEEKVKDMSNILRESIYNQKHPDGK